MNSELGHTVKAAKKAGEEVLKIYNTEIIII